MLGLPKHAPDDFDETFVKIGRLACEAHYGAQRITIDRWLRERGKQRLIDAREAFVAQQRSKGEWITRQTRLVAHREIKRPSVRETIRDKRKVNVVVARHAAQFLRVVRNGGFIVSPSSDGCWWVGSRRLSAAQMVDFAKGKGFQDKVIVLTSGDPPLHPSGDEEVKQDQ